MKNGTVYLIGAGPGDPGLITVKGLECLSRAEVVVYDNLANPRFLSSCPAGCEMIYAGKKAGEHTLSQHEINALLVERARSGKTVVRLKGGDPFVFGRGGEEALALREAGVDFEVVPGVTAGVAAPAYAGIPVTHRFAASSVAFVTGHEDPQKPDSSIDWKSLAGTDTLVFYMGVRNLPLIARSLLENGKANDTPAALIRLGTTPAQETVTGTLEDIPARAAEMNLKPPALLVVGEVVALRDKLAWLEKRPLFGRHIVVTRSRNQASRLREELERLGAQVEEFPTIEIRPVLDSHELELALEQLETYAWLLFTSANGVECFFEGLSRTGRDTRALSGSLIGVIGPGTADKLADYGLRPDFMPGKYLSEQVVEDLAAMDPRISGKRVLMPVSYIARPVIPDGLRALGAEVDVVAVYDNNPPDYSGEDLDRVFQPLPDLVTFTSSSTAANLAEILKECGREELLQSIQGASIGPITSETARGLGITLAVEAGSHDIPGLVRAILGHFGGDGPVSDRHVRKGDTASDQHGAGVPEGDTASGPGDPGNEGGTRRDGRPRGKRGAP
jgi:uroporphyrinogen III methyltransferase/synthase